MAEAFALSIIIFLFSVILHEVAHGVVARYFGDHTAENAGRLTLNPIPHIDPFGSVLLPLLLRLSGSPILLGWAKPVPVNPLHFKDIKKGELWVSAAGPLTNLGLAIIAAIFYHLFSTPTFSLRFAGEAGQLLSSILRYSVDINALLAIFNLLPIPPLDGSKVVMSYLPYNLLVKYERLTPYGFLIILASSYLGILGPILGTALELIHSILGV